MAAGDRVTKEEAVLQVSVRDAGGSQQGARTGLRGVGSFKRCLRDENDLQRRVG